MKIFFAALFVILVHRAWAQDGAASSSGTTREFPPATSVQYPTVRPKPPEDPHPESSSFIGDAENLDPLRARQENLKEDAEPVLEDIKQVLDAPPPLPPQPLPPKVEEKSVVVKPLPPKKKVKKQTTTKKKALPPKIVKKKKPKVKAVVVRRDDDADEMIEKKFHNTYMRYNSEPTSVESWSTATFGRTQEVYIVQKGDTLWSISETLFGDSLFWPKIWALNRQGILNPHFITPGMKVRFYPGSPDFAPTLALGEDQEQNSSSAAAAGEKSVNDEFNPEENQQQEVAEEPFELSNNEMPSGLPSSEELSPSKQAKSKYPSNGTLVASRGSRPTPLPPSIPVYRSSLYYNKPNQVSMIDFSEPEKLDLQTYVDIFFTDRLVLSDIKISREGDTVWSCSVGDLLQNFEFIRKTPTDEYTMLEPLDKIKMGAKFDLYPYRRVGTVALYGDGKLKMKDCRTPVNKEILFVPTSKLEGLKTRKVSDKTPRIIGGPDVMNQQYFYAANILYLDMGDLHFEVGQVFGVNSKRTDSISGQLRVLDRFGSYAVGIVVNQLSEIAVDDQVVIQK